MMKLTVLVLSSLLYAATSYSQTQTSCPAYNGPTGSPYPVINQNDTGHYNGDHSFTVGGGRKLFLHKLIVYRLLVFLLRLHTHSYHVRDWNSIRLLSPNR